MTNCLLSPEGSFFVSIPAYLTGFAYRAGLKKKDAAAWLTVD
jgi:hypothetical protein